MTKYLATQSELTLRTPERPSGTERDRPGVQYLLSPGLLEIRHQSHRDEVIEVSGTKGPRVIDSESSATEEARDTGTAISFERIGWFSGVIGSLSVIVSFVYDWGFFAALGISFADAPTTISDHIRSWLVRLPLHW